MIIFFQKWSDLSAMCLIIGIMVILTSNVFYHFAKYMKVYLHNCHFHNRCGCDYSSVL